MDIIYEQEIECTQISQRLRRIKTPNLSLVSGPKKLITKAEKGSQPVHSERERDPLTKPKSKRRERVFKYFKKKKGKSKTTVEIQKQRPLKRIVDIHEEVEDVTHTLRDNIVKMRDRDGKLEHLVEQGERLEEGANQFAVMTKNVRCKICLRNHKKKLGVVLIVLIVLIVIIMIILWKTGVI